MSLRQVHNTMGAKVLTHMCMSLDGFVAAPDDNPAELFDWYWGGEVVVPSGQETMNHPGSNGGSGYLIPTGDRSACWAA
jgi:hypothetical protein